MGLVVLRPLALLAVPRPSELRVRVGLLVQVHSVVLRSEYLPLQLSVGIPLWDVGRRPAVLLAYQTPDRFCQHFRPLIDFVGISDPGHFPFPISVQFPLATAVAGTRT
eukprot:COSAG03_NODE_15656_length_424_cov_0.710769_1_plen_107_part_10